jgi:hypothetical protein
MRCLAIGDLHIDGLASYFTPDKGLELQVKALERHLDLAVKDKCDTVVFLGDLFDTHNPRQRAVRALAQVLTSKKYCGLDLFAYLGNHDKEGDDHAFAMLQTLESLCENLTFADEPLHLDGLSFLPHPYSTCEHKNRIVFCHREFKGTKRDNGSVYDSTPFDKDMAARLNQYWVGGHLHTEQKYARLWYPGTWPTRYLPKRQHYVLRIDWDEREALGDKHFQLIEYQPLWGLYRVDVYNEKDEEEIHSLLATKNQEVRVKAVVHPPYVLSSELQKHAQVVHEGSIPDLFTPVERKKQREAVAVDTTDAEWVAEHLPRHIKRNPVLHRRAKQLIAKAHKK